MAGSGSSERRDASFEDYAQITVCALVVTVVLFVFAVVEHGTSTKVLGFVSGAVFGAFTLFSAATTLALRRGPRR